MASVHEIGIAADTRGFDEGVRSGIIKPLEKAEEAFKDLEKAASDAGRDGARDVTKLEDALEDARRQSERLADSVDDVGTGGRAAMDKVKGGAQEVQQEIGQNLGEAVSSIRGDMSDLGQVGQDTLGGLAATLAGTGPAGIAGAAALAAGAVGLGLVTASLQEQQEQAEKLKERLSDAYTEAARAGRDYLDQVQVISQVQDLAFDPERAEEWKQVQADAKQLGMDTKDVAAAYVGDLDKQHAVMDRITALEQDRLDRARAYVEQHGTLSTPLTNERIALEEISGRWEDLNGVTQETAAAQATGIRTVSRLLEDQYANTEGVIKKTGELGDRIYELPDGKTLYIDAETGQATEDLEAFNQINLRNKTAQVSVIPDTSAWDNWRPAPKYGLVTGDIRTTGLRMMP
ncbi:hypothetical protein [Microbacterium aurum]|uniref:hypothetical protein n=1 Tax=Microbacterium aurum TaxID=36805 RepID=UPI0028EBDE54|nr:hypothetical protein [Microbacterium aurum]